MFLVRQVLRSLALLARDQRDRVLETPPPTRCSHENAGARSTAPGRPTAVVVALTALAALASARVRSAVRTPVPHTPRRAGTRPFDHPLPGCVRADSA